jgi:hypothetical protein
VFAAIALSRNALTLAVLRDAKFSLALQRMTAAELRQRLSDAVRSPST